MRQMTSVWTLGINHHTAPLDVRARFAFAANQLPSVLLRLREALAWRGSPANSIETTILSTCNRTEIYGSSAAPEASEECAMALHWLSQTGGLAPEHVRPYAYALYGSAASRHAFRVASGLDSMVLGEAQILGQLKDAVRAAEDAGTMGRTLHQLFQRSFAVAKEVRTQTEVGNHSISMAAAAVRLATQLFEDLPQCKILFIGAGEMIALAATHFAAKQPQRMAIANRSPERALALAQRFHAQVLPLADVPQHLSEFDIVVSCTASTLPLIGLGAVERALKVRKHRPMMMVDLAVPRDIEAEVRALDDVFLYTVDDLAELVQVGHNKRQAAVAQAETIVDAGVLDFERWLQQRSTVPIIQSLQERSSAWQEQEIQRALKMLSKGSSADDALRALAHGLAQKMLNGALQQLKNPDTQARLAAEQAIQAFFLQGQNSPVGKLPAPLAAGTGASSESAANSASPPTPTSSAL